MRRTFFFILFCLFAFAFLISCRRYPDGPCISFRSIDKRIKGTHQIVSIVANGIDSTYWFPIPGASDQQKQVSFYEPKGQNNWMDGCFLGEWTYENHVKEL